jgi:hypothetical protein
MMKKTTNILASNTHLVGTRPAVSSFSPVNALRLSRLGG